MTNREMLDMIEEKIHRAIEECLPQEYAMKGIIRHIVGKVLSLQTLDCRVAVVRKEGELPENPYSENWAKAVKILQDSPINSQERKVAHIDKANYGGDMDIYTKTQQDMLKAGYIQEVRNE